MNTIKLSDAIWTDGKYSMFIVRKDYLLLELAIGDARYMAKKQALKFMALRK